MSHQLSSLPVYQKALEIFTLSQSISTYLNYDLVGLNEDGSENTDIYFSGDIVQQSTSLGPEILKAELESCSNRRRKYAKRVRRLSYLLYKNSLRLEKCQSNGREFLPLLRSELKKFQQLQRNWMLTL